MSPVPDPAHPADVGLLSPVWVGTTAEALTSDEAIAATMVAVEAALSRVLFEHGLAAAVDLPPRALDVRRLACDAVGLGNPTVPLLTELRADLPADQARGLHHGATSQDLVDTALMVVASSVLADVEGTLVGLADHLALLVDQQRHTPCVARTLTQQALPTTLGFRVATWLAGVHDALAAVRGCRPLPVSLGGPVGTAAAYGTAGPDVVSAAADLLGLGVPDIAWHTRRTPVLGLAAALTAVGQACGTIVADLLLMGQTEVGEASDDSGGGSSAMRHKVNPTRSVLVASAAHQLPGYLALVASCGAAASERPAGEWHAEWQPLRTMLRLAGAAAERTRAVAEQTTFHPEAMRRNLGMLLAVLGEDDTWVATQVAHVDGWVDRVLTRHAEELR